MDNIIEITAVIGGIASSFLAILAFFGAVATQSNKGKQKIKAWAKRSLGIEELASKIDDIKNQLNQRAECEVEIKKDLQSQTHALQCILRKEIREMCEYCIENESVSIKDRETIAAAFHAYQSLNGNSFVCGLVERTLALPIDNNN